MLPSDHPHKRLIRLVERQARDIMIADYHRLLQSLQTANASPGGRPAPEPMPPPGCKAGWTPRAAAYKSGDSPFPR